MENRESAIGDTPALTEMAQDTTTALENLSTATTTNRNTFNELTKTIANQSSQIITLKNKLLLATEAASKPKTEIAVINLSYRYIGQGSGF